MEPNKYSASEWYDLAMAAGQDAANARARKAGRTVWTRGDYNLACRTTARLIALKG